MVRDFISDFGSVVQERDYTGILVFTFMTLAMLFVVVGVLFAVVVVPYDHYTATHEHSYGVVISKSYTPSTSSSGTGFTSSGKIVFVNSSSPERFVLLVRDDGGHVDSHEVYADNWYSLTEGDRVLMEWWRGGVTGDTWGSSIAKAAR